ncbi:hypothetical protein K456DRAFT_484476 [Colletotrichum gloeosporioides 23]|nr:hypothetical protein K456DRAFT_484476 [Colletotrichum gloeosporioides 23]
MGHQFQRANFSDSWNSENTDSGSDSRKHYKSNIKKDCSRHHVTALKSTDDTKVKRGQHSGDRTWRRKAASDIREDSSGRGNRRRPEALDPSLFVSRLSGLTIGEKDGVVSGSCSTLTSGQAPPLEPNTAQAASLRSMGKPTSTLDESLLVQKPQPLGCRVYYSALSSSQPVSKSLGKGSCIPPEPDSGNEIDEIEVYAIHLHDSEDEADKTEARVRRLPDPEASVKPNIYGQWRPVPERPKRDNTNEMPTRMLAAIFRGTTDKQKGGKRSSDRASTALWQPKIKPKIKPKEDKQDGLHLACPYTKCDDATQEQLFRCRAKAFPDTHRLKQHLYSVHRQKPNCARCGEIFASKVGLEAHSRLIEGCNLSQKICIEGFNSTQEEQLRSKKRQPNLRTEEDKWRDIFRILFPDCRNIPDPRQS